MNSGISQKVEKKTILISYFSQFFQYGLAVLVLPVILSKMAAEDIGIWYMFLSISSMIKLLDLGFAPSIQRNIAYVAAGAKELKREGYGEPTKNGIISDSLMLSLIQTSRFIYKRISTIVLLSSLFLGTFYLYYALGVNFTVKILIIWLIYTFGITFDLYYSYILSILKGMGFISEYNINIIVSKSAYIIILYILVYFDYGLASLVFATFSNVVIMVVLGFFDLYRKVSKFKMWIKSKEYENLFPILWKNARNSGVVSIGVFLLSQAGILIAGLYLNVTEVAQLGLIIQLYGILVILSRVYLTTYTPQLSSLWVTNDIKKIRSIFVNCQLIGYFIFCSGVLFFYFLGNWALVEIMHSNVLLPNGAVILLYGFFYFMEITHGNCCTLISTANNIPFVKASIISGVISVLCTLLFIYCNFRMLSFPLALVCGSLPYNSWKWVLECYKLLNPKII